MSITNTSSNCIDITEFWSQESWDSGMGPLDSAFLDENQMVDVTQDPRWFDEFVCTSRLGAYEGPDGLLYVAEDRPAAGEILLVRIGREDDLLEELGLATDKD